MTFINLMAREINCKIVYYGPGLCGKTTNLQHIYDRTKPDAKGKMVSLATETDRTLFFDFLPLELGEIRGFKTRFHLYTVPGQVFYDASRKLILKGVDGCVFVADSQIARADANEESLENLKENLAEYGMNLSEIPYVLQYNKRDLPSVMSVEEMRSMLNPEGVPEFEAIASEGDGVFETLKAVARLVFLVLKKSGAGAGGLGEALAAAEAMLTDGTAVDAAETFAAILGEDPESAAAYGGMVRAHLALDNLDQAEGMLAAVPAKIAESPEVEAARAQLALLRQAASAGPVGELQARVEADPDDLQARFDLARAQHASGQVQAAVDTLLDLFRRDRDWNDGAAKAQLFTIFEALKPTDPIVLKGRRKLSSMIFV